MITIENTYFDELPIGAVVSIYNTFLGDIPDYLILCDGSVISDSDSPLNGQTVPNINGENRFIRGNTVSGGTGGTNSNHTHTINSWPLNGGTGGGSAYAFLSGLVISSASHLPPYINVQFYLRYK